MHRSVEFRRRRAAVLTLGLVTAASIGMLRFSSVAEARSNNRVANPQGPDGKAVYGTTCAACHQATGDGVSGVYPPLAGSEWVNGDEAKIARIVLHGLTGPVEVAGETYSGMMPPWGGVLKDPELAAVLSYIRSSWGNKATPVTAAKIASIRAATTARTTPWTAAELAAIK
jgi:mono/diheme cytochrome c family protein